VSIHAVAYVSTSRERLIAPATMDRLLANAKKFNDSCGVTGVLIHHDGNFFQYLEGSAESVKIVYDRVLKSTSHYGIVEMLNSEVEQRHFSTWSMGFAEATKTELQQISQATWNLQLDQISNQPQQSQGLVLLLSFWERVSPTVKLFPEKSNIRT
jgi:Sensors of blue-light using FAD